MKSCPVCTEPLSPGGTGRPPTFCSVDCRREMAARRRDVIQIEAELAEARERLHDERWRPGREHYWASTIRMVEVQLAEARMRVGPASRPRPVVVGRRETRP